MLFYTHLTLGLLFYVLFIKLGMVSNQTSFLLILIGSILPDLDHPKSKIAIPILTPILNWIFGHRGALHSILGSLIFGIITFFIVLFLGAETPYQFGLFIFLGSLAHLIGDAMTLRGVQFFQPFSDAEVSGFIKTGGVFEHILMVVMLIGIGYFVAKYGISITVFGNIIQF